MGVLRLGRTAAIALAIGVVLAACRGDDFGIAYWAQNDSDAAAIVQFGGTPDAPGTSAYIVPAGVGGVIYPGQEPGWKGRIAVVDDSCKTRWEQRIGSGGLIAIAKDRTVTWSAGLAGPAGSAQASDVTAHDIAEWPACSIP